MINLRKGNTEVIYFTGTENATLTNPYFLFIFTNRATKEVVKVMVTNTSTSSRYDKGSVVVNTYFSNQDNGLWDYEVREKASASDMTVSGTVVEQGFMLLKPATDFAPSVYDDQSNTFKTYNGS